MANRNPEVNQGYISGDEVLGTSKTRFDYLFGHGLLDFDFSKTASLLPEGDAKKRFEKYIFPKVSNDELSSSDSSRMNHQILVLFELAKFRLQTGEDNETLILQASEELDQIFDQPEIPQAYKEMNQDLWGSDLVNKFLKIDETGTEATITALHQVGERMVPGREVVYELSENGEMQISRLTEYYWSKVEGYESIYYLVSRTLLQGNTIDTVYIDPFDMKDIERLRPSAIQFHLGNLYFEKVTQFDGFTQDYRASLANDYFDLLLFDQELHPTERKIIFPTQSSFGHGQIYIDHRLQKNDEDGGIWKTETVENIPTDDSPIVKQQIFIGESLALLSANKIVSRTVKNIQGFNNQELFIEIPQLPSVLSDEPPKGIINYRDHNGQWQSLDFNKLMYRPDNLLGYEAGNSIVDSSIHSFWIDGKLLRMKSDSMGNLVLHDIFI